MSCVRVRGEGCPLRQAVVINNYVPLAAHMYFPGRHVGSVDVRAAPTPPYPTLPYPGYLQYQLNR